MSTLRKHRDTLLSVLEPFVKDPVIDWKRNKSKQERGNASKTHINLVAARRSIKVIEERLHGIYNLRNPNFLKYKRTDGVSHDDEDGIHELPLSVEGQIHRMIAEATNNENLVQLYVGWMPWV